MRVVLDTNVFISGIFWNGDSRWIISAWKTGSFQLVASKEIISEITRVLKDFKIKMPDNMIKNWVSLIESNSLVVEPKEKIRAVKDDPKDDMFIEAAVTGKAEFIVSKDKHLLKLKEFRKIKIIRPAEFKEVRIN
ncbi:MAG: putative toxin-antitoxin system toxin component, PIN family [Nanoarchaeota archaeon]|nr:MAG: putative toxin-antitoxin system toxin component, PIN family [Nanoarchaeota archaeon]